DSRRTHRLIDAERGVGIARTGSNSHGNAVMDVAGEQGVFLISLRSCSECFGCVTGIAQQIAQFGVGDSRNQVELIAKRSLDLLAKLHGAIAQLGGRGDSAQVSSQRLGFGDIAFGYSVDRREEGGNVALWL